MSPRDDLTRRAIRRVRSARQAVLALTALLTVSATACGAEPTWVGGAELARQLAAPASVRWSGASVRSMLEGLSQFQHVAVLLDRRLDPSRTIDLTLEGESLAGTLATIAQRLGGGYAQVGPLAYLGPAETAGRLRTIVALRRSDVQKLPAARQAIWLKPVAWSWDDLTTPRELLERLAAEGDVSITDLERVPHDLWAGAQLPPLSLVERLSIVLAEFDLTFSLDPSGSQIGLEPMPREVAVERAYPAGSQPQATFERLKKLAPSSHLELLDDTIVVRGPIEDHERIAGGSTKTGSKGPAPVGQQVHTLNLDNVPLSAVLKALQKQLGIELRMDAAAIAAADINLDQLISVHVDRVSTDELLKAVLEPAGLAIRDDSGVRVIAPQPAP